MSAITLYTLTLSIHTNKHTHYNICIFVSILSNITNFYCFNFKIKYFILKIMLVGERESESKSY